MIDRMVARLSGKQFDPTGLRTVPRPETHCRHCLRGKKKNYCSVLRRNFPRIQRNSSDRCDWWTCCCARKHELTGSNLCVSFCLSAGSQTGMLAACEEEQSTSFLPSFQLLLLLIGGPVRAAVWDISVVHKWPRALSLSCRCRHGIKTTIFRMF